MITGTKFVYTCLKTTHAEKMTLVDGYGELKGKLSFQLDVIFKQEQILLYYVS